MSAQQKAVIIILGIATQCIITYFDQGNAARFFALVASCGALTAVHFSQPAGDVPQPPKVISHPSSWTMSGQQKAIIVIILGLLNQAIITYFDQGLTAQVSAFIASCGAFTAVCFALPAGDAPGEWSLDGLPA